MFMLLSALIFFVSNISSLEDPFAFPYRFYMDSCSGVLKNESTRDLSWLGRGGFPCWGCAPKAMLIATELLKSRETAVCWDLLRRFWSLLKR